MVPKQSDRSRQGPKTKLFGEQQRLFFQTLNHPWIFSEDGWECLNLHGTNNTEMPTSKFPIRKRNGKNSLVQKTQSPRGSKAFGLLTCFQQCDPRARATDPLTHHCTTAVWMCHAGRSDGCTLTRADKVSYSVSVAISEAAAVHSVRSKTPYDPGRLLPSHMVEVEMRFLLAVTASPGCC